MAPTKSGDALVTPNQVWERNGSALVGPLDPLPYQTRTLPLENRSPGTYTIAQTQYIQGIVIVNSLNRPTSSPATLPLVATAASAIVVDGDYFSAFPNGFIIWFLTG